MLTSIYLAKDDLQLILLPLPPKYKIDHKREPPCLTYYFYYLVYVHGYYVCMHVCVPCTCLAPAEAREDPEIPWEWSYRWL